MNNLFGNPMQSPFSPIRNMPMARSGEPVSVNGIESVKTFPTMPNTITILFHEKDPIFYKLSTDGNNHPNIEVYNYSKIESPVDKTRTATLEDLDRMKEDLINEWQHIWSEPANISNRKHATDTTDVKDSGSQSNSPADAAEPRKSESSIW